MDPIRLDLGVGGWGLGGGGQALYGETDVGAEERAESDQVRRRRGGQEAIEDVQRLGHRGLKERRVATACSEELEHAEAHVRSVHQRHLQQRLDGHRRDLGRALYHSHLDAEEQRVQRGTKVWQWGRGSDGGECSGVGTEERIDTKVDAVDGEAVLRLRRRIQNRPQS